MENYYSKAINKKFIVNDKGLPEFEDGVKYTLQEIQVLKTCNSDEALKAIHKLKLVFDGELLPEEIKHVEIGRISQDENYQIYMRSEKWRNLRYKKLMKAGFKCERCRSTDRLEVHHKHYDNFTKETESDLVVLCKRCHIMADDERVSETIHGNAIHTYMCKKYGDNYDLKGYMIDEFNEWLERKEYEQ